MKTRFFAARILARTTIVALFAVFAAFFAGCGDQKQDGDRNKKDDDTEKDLGERKDAIDKSDQELSIGINYIVMSQEYAESELDRERQLNKGLEYLRKSAEHDNMDAMFFVAVYYWEKEEDEEMALKWARKAGDKGHKDAKDLIRKIKSGKGNSRAADKKYYTEAVEEDKSAAMDARKIADYADEKKADSKEAAKEIDWDYYDEAETK